MPERLLGKDIIVLHVSQWFKLEHLSGLHNANSIQNALWIKATDIFVFRHSINPSAAWKQKGRCVKVWGYLE